MLDVLVENEMKLFFILQMFNVVKIIHITTLH